MARNQRHRKAALAQFCSMYGNDLTHDIKKAMTYEGEKQPVYSGQEGREPQPGCCYHSEGVTEQIDVGDIGNVKSISFWIKPVNASGTEGLIYLNSSDQIQIVNGDITLVGFSGATTNVYVDNTATPTVGSGTFKHVVITSDTNIDANDLSWFTDGTLFFEGSMYDVRFFSDEISSSQRERSNKGLLVGSELAWFGCQERDGTKAIDLSGNDFHGDITNATLSSFHTTDNDVKYNIHNLYWYIPLLYANNDSYYTSTFSKDYSSGGTNTGFTWGCFWSNQGGAYRGVLGSDGNIAIRQEGGFLDLLFGGFSMGVNNFTGGGFGDYGINPPFLSISIAPNGNYELFRNGELETSGNLTNPTIAISNIRILCGRASQRLIGYAAQFFLCEGVLSEHEQTELFKLARSNRVINHSRFSDFDMYVPGIGEIKDYSRNQIKFTENVGSPKYPIAPSTIETNLPKYQGATPFNPKLVESHCLTFNGVDQKLSFTDLTGVTVLSSEGTATPTINGNDIEFTAGTLWDLVLSDGTRLPCAEGDGSNVYDVSGNANHATITNYAAAMWNDTQDEFHWNAIYGYYDNSGVKVPSKANNPYEDVLGNPITPTFSRKWNNPESKLQLNPFNAPELIQAGFDDTYLEDLQAPLPSNLTLTENGEIIIE